MGQPTEKRETTSKYMADVQISWGIHHSYISIWSLHKGPVLSVVWYAMGIPLLPWEFFSPIEAWDKFHRMRKNTKLLSILIIVWWWILITKRALIFEGYNVHPTSMLLNLLYFMGNTPISPNKKEKNKPPPNFDWM